MRGAQYKKIAGAAALLAVIGGLALFLRGREDQIWRVVGMVPPGIIRETIDTPTYYLIRQTHEPFLRCNDLQNYTSKVLRDWKRSVDYRQFVFYPDTSLKFDRNARLTKEIFDEQISSVTAKFGASFELHSDSDSVTVEFQSPQKQYLYFLTWYENAPAIQRGNLEYGLGEFYISSYTPDMIVMERKRKVGNGYNRIEFYNYRGENDPRLQDRRVQDFNLLSLEQQPQWITSEYSGVKNPDPRSVVLLLNHPDRQVRERLYNCIDVRGFRKAFFGKRDEFYDIGTVLPAGIPGAKPGLPRQDCGQLKAGGEVMVSLINLRNDNAVTLPPFLNALHREAGIRIREKKMEYKDLVKVLNNPRHEPYWYNLFQIYLDTFRPDYKVFFEYTSGKNTFLGFRSPTAEKLFAGLLKADDFSEQARLAEELADLLGKEALVLPLFQTYSTVYYPRKIKNIVLGNGFRQYPEIADLRW